jgi:hypothetical protein
MGRKQIEIFKYMSKGTKSKKLGEIFLLQYIRQFRRDLVLSHFSIIARDKKNYAVPHKRNTRKTWIDDPQIDHKIRYQELIKRGRNTWIFRRIMILYNMFLSEHFFGAVTWAQVHFDTSLDIDTHSYMNSSAQSGLGIWGRY